MFVDQSLEGTLRKWLSEHGDELQNERSDALLSPWRTLSLTDLQPNEVVLERARALLVLSTEWAEVELKPDPWPALREITQQEWRARSLNALLNGLAYAPMSPSLVPKTPQERALGELVDRLLAPLSGATFATNLGEIEFGSTGSVSMTYAPLSNHTMDALFIAHDSLRLILIFVVDED